MEKTSEQLVTIIETVWASTLGIEVKRGAEGAGPGHPGHRVYTSCVTITGAWHGALTIECHEALAKEAAGLMFGSEEVSVDDVRDALGELANMTGGNFKNCLPGPCQISIPTVVEGGDYDLTLPRTRLVARVHFLSGEKSFAVAVHREEASSRPNLRTTFA